jgi:spore germination protein PC
MMCMNPELLRYLQYLNGCMQAQYQQIQQLNAAIQQLSRDVNQWNGKAAQPPVIQNEYNFDLLKIERLEGTLNIGIKPDGNGADASIEELAVGQSMEVPSLIEKQHPDLYKGIQKQVNDYWDHEAYSALKKLESQYQYPLDDPYRTFIVDDVKKQIDKRISYYLNQIKSEELRPEEADHYRQPVFEKVKYDIEKTFETFIRNLPRKENNL